ncbi:MAG: extracellular solute-binding protein [Clostridiales bacterium]|nr:extracellular solute-binding protein [Clostridiales bacterium]
MKGKSVKSLLAAILVFVMSISLMGCNKSKEAKGDVNQEGKPITLRMIQRLPATYVVQDNPVIKEWEKRTNTILDIEAPPINNYNDRLNIVMASGDLPDIIMLGGTGTTYQQWAKDGLLLKLDDYFNNGKMPNAKKVLTDEELSFTRVANMNNELYSLPRVQTKPWDNIVYRKDWLDKVGLKVPTTPEEFKQVMLAFAKDDPDGNGKNDTFGFSYNIVMGPMDRNLINGFGIRPTSVPDENGNYQLMQAQDGYMKYMDWLHDMYANGSLDSEWYNTKMYEDDDKWAAGLTGAIYDNKVTEHMTATKTNDVRKVAPKAELVAGPPLRQEGKTVSDVYYAPQIWGNYGISASTKNKDQAVAFLDYGYTDECNELLAAGIQGVTYTSFDKTTRFAIKTADQKTAADKYCATYATINYQRQDKGLLMATGSTADEQDIFTKAFDEIGKQTNRITYLPEGSLAGINDENFNISNSGIPAKYTEYVTKYICGKITRQQFVDFIQKEYVPAYKGYMDIVSKSGINKKK